MLQFVRAPLVLAALWFGGIVPAVGAAPASLVKEARSLIDDRCAAEEISSAGCACHRDVLQERILAPAPGPHVARLAAMIVAGEAVDPMTMAKVVQNAGPDAMQAATRLALGAQLAFEACDDRAREAQRRAERAVKLPEGNDPRSRFVRQCAGQNGQVGVCECVADELLKNVSPLELAVMVDLRAARERGDEAMRAFAEERGMTVEEAEQALMQMGGRISGAMMSIDPAACAAAAR